MSSATAPTPPSHDRILRGTLLRGSFRYVAARLTDTTALLARRHGLGEGPTRILGEALAATAMLSTPLKTADEKYSLALHGEGVLASVHADVNQAGDLRGYLRLRDPDANALPPDALLSAANHVRVTRARPGQVIYQAVTEMRLGSIAADLAFHASMSDQVETELCVFDVAGAGARAFGGLLVQAMPGAQLDDFVPIRERLHGRSAIRPTADLVDRPEQLVKTYLSEFEPQLLEVAPLQMLCTCSRERVESIFAQLQPGQLHDLLLPDGSAFADCQWCGEKYVFSSDEMNAFLLRDDPKGRSH